METQGFREHNVIATFEDMAAARRGVSALENRGVDAAYISLLGPTAEAAATEDGITRDERVTDEMTKSGVGGALAGTAVGGTVGFLAGVATFGIPGVGPVIAGGIWAMTLGGAAAGSGVGLAATAYATVKQSEAWELTYSEVQEGRVAVGVHWEGDEVEGAEQALESAGALRIDRYDREGRRLAA